MHFPTYSNLAKVNTPDTVTITGNEASYCCSNVLNVFFGNISRRRGDFNIALKLLNRYPQYDILPKHMKTFADNNLEKTKEKFFMVNWTFGWLELIGIISLVSAGIGAIFALIKWTKTLQRNNIEFLQELIDKFMKDSEIHEISYMFDYDTFRYDKNFNGGSDLERKVDKTLAFYSYICHLKEKKIIKDEEFIFFQYRINRALTNKDLKKYLFNLYHFSQRINKPLTFQKLFDYGVKNNYFEDEFFDKNNRNYPHYLNF